MISKLKIGQLVVVRGGIGELFKTSKSFKIGTVKLNKIGGSSGVLIQFCKGSNWHERGECPTNFTKHIDEGSEYAFIWEEDNAISLLKKDTKIARLVHKNNINTEIKGVPEGYICLK